MSLASSSSSGSRLTAEQAGHWRPLTTGAQRLRFAQIMQLMADHYASLEAAIERWWESKEQKGLHPEIYGWFPADNPQRLLLVMALAGRRDATGARADMVLRMLGAAADLIPESQNGEENIRSWLAQYYRLLLALLGQDGEFSAVRPKTMAWTPMQRLHDLVREGFTFDAEHDGYGGVFRADVVKERDCGHKLYWTIRIRRLDD